MFCSVVLLVLLLVCVVFIECCMLLNRFSF